MEFIGDLERAFAASLYPLRIPIAIGLAVVALIVARAAIRGRWDLAARRHPRRTLAVGISALVVGLPLAWYLGSPLLITTELVERSPSSGTVVASGEFAGADEFHFGSGTASIVETAPGRYALRFDDFAVRNGPDLFVYLSPEVGYAADAIELGALKASEGSFTYELPEGVDPSTFRSAVVWCRAFSVLFATAPLGAG